MNRKIALVLFFTLGINFMVNAEIIENVKIRVGDREFTYTLFDTIDELHAYLIRQGDSLFNFIDRAYYLKSINRSTGGVDFPNRNLSPNVINTMNRYNKKISYTHVREGNLDYYRIHIYDSAYGYFVTYTNNGL